MTRSEYSRKKAAVRNAGLKETMARIAEARRMYRRQLEKVNRVVVKLPKGKLSEESIARIDGVIDKRECVEKLTAIVSGASLKMARRVVSVDADYITDAGKEAGVEFSGLKEAFDRIARKATERNRRTAFVFRNSTKYNLSEAVWNAVEGFSDKLKAVVEAEFARGTDPVKIARLLEEYLESGDEGIILGRWGEMEPGMSDYRKRIGRGGADFRTQRLVRTEIFNSIRNADIRSGAANPGTTGKWRWVMVASRGDWDCDCPSRAAGGPYTQERVQELVDTAHPNCFCRIEPELMEHDAFIESLLDYVDGKDTAGARRVEEWSGQYDVIAA
jgi:hypothetical protein